MQNNLKPCPFCGSDHVRVIYGLNARISGILCADCRAYVKWTNLDTLPSDHQTYGAVAELWKEHWNRRG